MELPVGEALLQQLKLIDNVNDRSMLNGLTATVSVIVAAALRRQGLLSAIEVDMIDRTLAGVAEEWPAGRAEQPRKVLQSAQAVWEAAAPKEA